MFVWHKYCPSPGRRRTGNCLSSRDLALYWLVNRCSMNRLFWLHLKIQARQLVPKVHPSRGKPFSSPKCLQRAQMFLLISPHFTSDHSAWLITISSDVQVVIDITDEFQRARSLSCSQKISISPRNRAQEAAESSSLFVRFTLAASSSGPGVSALRFPDSKPCKRCANNC